MLDKLQFIEQIRSVRMGNDHHCHCEERSDVAIPRYNFASI